jgi:chromosome segregation ATPase
MQKERIQVSARIPKDLYDNCIQLHGNITTAINTALEILISRSENTFDKNENGDRKHTMKEGIVKTAENESNANENRLNSIENSHGELKARIEEKDSRIEDMREQVKALYDQLHTKDNQIEQLNENMHKQAVHIQTLIQENSKLNIKLLPENSEIKKPWWKFW